MRLSVKWVSVSICLSSSFFNSLCVCVRVCVCIYKRELEKMIMTDVNKKKAKLRILRKGYKCKSIETLQ